MMYLSGCVVPLRHRFLGYLLTPDMGNSIPRDTLVAADNGCFTKPQGYSDKRYRKFLEKFPVERTLFATAPDVVGDFTATIKRSHPVLRVIRELGLPPALVAQDGWSEQATPWDEFDALFIGGTTKFKLEESRRITYIAKKHKKFVHMGRVNSLRRMLFAWDIGCDSVDGTYLRFGPQKNGPKLMTWLDVIHNPTFLRQQLKERALQ